MRRSNGGVIWLLIAGASIAFAFSELVAYFLQLQSLIPAFIILVLGGYICARVIGRVGGEFSVGAKTYSIILEGFVFGFVLDLLRFRYDFFINVFKHIAIGSLFILMAMVFKSSLQKYTEKNPTDGPHLGLMRNSILYIMAGFCFALAITSVLEAFLKNIYFVAALPLLLGIAILVMITAKADFDLLDDRSGAWQQLLAGAALGVIYDLLFFINWIWEDLIELFIMFAIVAITASVIRAKEATAIKSEGLKIDLESTKTKKKHGKVVGTIDLVRKQPSESTQKKKKRRF